MRAVHFAQKDILPVVTPSHLPWLYSKRVLDVSLNKHAKSDTSLDICPPPPVENVAVGAVLQQKVNDLVSPWRRLGLVEDHRVQWLVQAYYYA